MMNQATAEQPFAKISQETSSIDQEMAPNPQLDTNDTEGALLPSANAMIAEPDSQQTKTVNPSQGQPNLDLIMKIPVDVQVILGTTRMPVSKLMKLGRNAVIALDRQVGDPIDVVVNGRVVARGEVVLMEDDTSRFGISLTEIVDPNVSCE